MFDEDFNAALTRVGQRIQANLPVYQSHQRKLPGFEDNIAVTIALNLIFQSSKFVFFAPQSCLLIAGQGSTECVRSGDWVKATKNPTWPHSYNQQSNPEYLHGIMY